MIERERQFRRPSLAIALVGAFLVQRLALAAPVALSLTQLPGNPAETEIVSAPTPLITDTTAPETMLTYRLSAEFSCEPGSTRTELFVTITDTVKIIDLTRRASPQIIELEVPWARAPWLNGHENCAARGKDEPIARDSGGLPYFRLTAHSTAFGTLLCQGPGQRQPRITTMVPLDVWLRCPVEPVKSAQPPASIDSLKEHLGE